MFKIFPQQRAANHLVSYNTHPSSPHISPNKLIIFIFLNFLEKCYLYFMKEFNYIIIKYKKSYDFFSISIFKLWTTKIHQNILQPIPTVMSNLWNIRTNITSMLSTTCQIVVPHVFYFSEHAHMPPHHKFGHINRLLLFLTPYIISVLLFFMDTTRLTAHVTASTLLFILLSTCMRNTTYIL